LDVEVVERVESELDRIVEKRARERREANEVEELWAESTRRHNHRIREENRLAWRDFHQHMQALHDALAAEHRAKALALETIEERTQHD
jgi:hypothetical protein